MFPAYFNQYLEKHHFVPGSDNRPASGLSVIVVIPCYNEPDILLSLESLYSCERPSGAAEVLVVMNYPEGSDELIVRHHDETVTFLKSWIQERNDSHLTFHIIDAPALPKKFAGVGLARKIGMDEAVHRFSLVNIEEGIICGFDADSTVDKNYLKAVEEHFRVFPKTPGASIYFEHPVEDMADQRLKSGIIQYETHLRYLVNAIRYFGFPYSYHTVGSSFAVKAKAYVKQGGMNRFKAGEDFYFINKIIPLGGYTEINTTRVLPQARVSARVPFGTGASMIKWMENDDTEFLTYQLDSFLPLKMLFENLDIIFKEKLIPDKIIKDPALLSFLRENDYKNAINEVLRNSSTFETFTKRFFGWFDAFRIVKFLNFASLNGYDKRPVIGEAQKLLSVNGYQKTISSAEEMLQVYRKWDRKQC